jgi:hypothetical protein
VNCSGLYAAKPFLKSALQLTPALSRSAINAAARMVHFIVCPFIQSVTWQITRAGCMRMDKQVPKKQRLNSKTKCNIPDLI